MTFSGSQVYEMIAYQIGAVDAIVRNLGGTLRHVKPHGALYNMAAVDKELAQKIVSAVKDFNTELVLFGLANSKLIEAAEDSGLNFRQEVFADRTYQDDGTLTPRQLANALIKDDEACSAQVFQMIKNGTVTSANGKTIPITPDTICLHGDGQNAVEFASMLHTKLRLAGFQISSR